MEYLPSSSSTLSSTQSYTCHFCAKIFSFEQTYQYHARRCQAKQILKAKKLCKSDTRLFPPQIDHHRQKDRQCVKRLSVLVKPLKTNIFAQYFVCNICFKVFEHRQYLQQHQQNVHWQMFTDKTIRHCISPKISCGYNCVNS